MAVTSTQPPAREARIITAISLDQWITYSTGIGTVLVFVVQSIILARQARLMKRAAITADRQADIMDQQSVIQTETYRPHVFLVGIDIDRQNDWYIFTPVWKNTGLTPPYQFKTGAQFDYAPGSVLPAGFDYSFPDGLITDVPIGVNMEVKVEPFMIGVSSLNDFQSRGQSGFLWGEAVYADRFSPHLLHRVEYCYRLYMRHGVPQFRPWGAHNRVYDTPVGE